MSSYFKQAKNFLISVLHTRGLKLVVMALFLHTPDQHIPDTEVAKPEATGGVTCTGKLSKRRRRASANGRERDIFVTGRTGETSVLSSPGRFRLLGSLLFRELTMGGESVGVGPCWRTLAKYTAKGLVTVPRDSGNGERIWVAAVEVDASAWGRLHVDPHLQPS